MLWFGVLWVLSSYSLVDTYSPPVSNIDKVQHFGYFFGGSGLLCAGLYRCRPDRPNWKFIISTTIVVIALVGWLDEYHQTFTPGRSGNDPYDWLADFAGAIAGAFTFKKLHRLLK